MNKNDLIASVASSAGLSKSDATRSIESFLDAVTNALKTTYLGAINGGNDKYLGWCTEIPLSN